MRTPPKVPRAALGYDCQKRAGGEDTAATARTRPDRPTNLLEKGAKYQENVTNVRRRSQNVS